MPGSYPCLHSHVKDPTVLTQPAPPVPQALSTSLHSSTSKQHPETVSTTSSKWLKLWSDSRELLRQSEIWTKIFSPRPSFLNINR